MPWDNGNASVCVANITTVGVFSSSAGSDFTPAVEAWIKWTERTMHLSLPLSGQVHSVLSGERTFCEEDDHDSQKRRRVKRRPKKQNWT